MDTYDTVLLTILTALLSILFIVGIAISIAILKLISTIKRVALKAEDVVDSVETAAEVFKDTQGKLAILKVIGNIIKLVQGGRK